MPRLYPRFALSALLIFAFATTSQAQQSLIEFVPSNSVLAIHGKPKAVFESPGMELLPKELIEVFGKKEMGLELLELEEILFVAAAPSDREMIDPPDFGVFARFAKPQKLGGRIMESGGAVADRILGKEGYRIDEAIVIQVDDRTMAMGIDADYLGRMLTAKNPAGPILKLMKATKPGDHFSMHFAVDPVREMIKSSLPPADQVPPIFSKYFKFVDLVDHISYSCQFSFDGAETLEIGAVDEAAAEEMVGLLREGLEFGKHLGLSWLAAESQIEDPDYQDAIVQYVNRMAAMISQQLEESRDGDKLRFEIQRGAMGGIAAAGMLVGITLPAVQQVRGAARRTQSMNNIRQMGLSMLNYESVHRHFPGQATYSPDGRPLLSWRVHILPFIDEQRLYDQFHLDEPWDSPHNRQLISKMPQIFASPDLPPMDGKTVYLAVSGENTIVNGDSKTKFTQITDGSSNTALLVEADPSEAVEWTKPEDWKFDPAEPLRGLGGIRPAGFIVLFADGSVRTVSPTVDAEVWKAICTMNGGEIVGFNDLD